MQLQSRFWITAASLLCLLAVPLITHAETLPQVYFSRIAWAGSELSNADEWIELTNSTDIEINISNWTIENAASGGESLLIPEESIIQANSTFIIANYEQKHEKTNLDTERNVTTASLSLSNSKLGLVLRDNAGSRIDAAGDGGKPFAGSAGGSGNEGQYLPMLRVDGQIDGALPEAWTDDSEPTTPTNPPEADDPTSPAQPDNPTIQPEAESPTPYTTLINFPSGTLIINEVLPNPTKDEEEFVEILNPYNNVIPLKGWRIRDKAGKETALPDQLLGFEQMVVLKNPNGKLNNQEELILLVDHRGSIIDQLEYGGVVKTPKKGHSLIRVDRKIKETVTPTPYAINILTEDMPEQKTSAKPKKISPGIITINETKQLPDKTEVKTTGQITAKPKTLGKQIFYMADEEAGIQVYKHDSEFPELELGEKVEVNGTLSTNQGEKRIKVTKTGSVTPIEKAEETIPIETTTIEEKDVGQLVSISGTVLSKTNKSIALETKNTQTEIRLPKQIQTETIEQGSELKVAGIVSSYNGELRVKPRSEQDLQITAEPKTETSQTNGKQIQKQKNQSKGKILAVISLLLLTVAYAANHRKRLRAKKSN